MENMLEMDYLYWYRRGDQPVLSRTKAVRPEINNKVVENHASEIVAFKNGYFLTQPAFYISRKEDQSVTKKVKRLNEYLYLSGKQQADNLVTDWFHTVGVGIIYVTPARTRNVLSGLTPWTPVPPLWSTAETREPSLSWE